MARSENGHHYPWYRDPVWCEAYGNGEIIHVEREEVVVLFQWWTGTMDNKHNHKRLCTIEKYEFNSCWCSNSGWGYWRLEGYE